MIQRIQTVYLFLAAAAVLAVPFVGGIATPEGWSWYPSTAIALAILVATVSIAAMFLYTQRSRQRSLVMADQIATLALIALLSLGVVVRDDFSAASLISLALPAVAYVLLFLARRAIGKDIELVRSMDRLR